MWCEVQTPQRGFFQCLAFLRRIARQRLQVSGQRACTGFRVARTYACVIRQLIAPAYDVPFAYDDGDMVIWIRLAGDMPKPATERGVERQLRQV